jgi:hypothetical protein
MPKFFNANIDRKGRIFRLLLGIALMVAGLLVFFSYSLWLGAILFISGVFGLFEAARGWCLMRACGIKTRL